MVKFHEVNVKLPEDFEVMVPRDVLLHSTALDVLVALLGPGTTIHKVDGLTGMCGWAGDKLPLCAGGGRGWERGSKGYQFISRGCVVWGLIWHGGWNGIRSTLWWRIGVMSIS